MLLNLPFPTALLKVTDWLKWMSLNVETLYTIDNAEQGKVTDGYYPCPIIVDTGEQNLLNIFDYRAILGHPPDIIRLQFDSVAFLK